MDEKEKHKEMKYKEKLKRNAEWRKNNRETINSNLRFKHATSYAYEYTQKYYQIVKRILKQIEKENYYNGKNQHLIGCSIEEFQKHIESQFVDGMTWENRNKVWHIDYIRKFGETKAEDMYKLIHYKNIYLLK